MTKQEMFTQEELDIMWTTLYGNLLRCQGSKDKKGKIAVHRIMDKIEKLLEKK